MYSLLSIIVLTTGTKERLEYLDKLLKSISNQTIKSFELIIASETNYDELKKLLRKYSLLRRNSKIIVTGYWNKCRTANEAIKASRGDIVLLLEDDLILKENFVEEIVKTFDIDSRIGCVYSKCIWVYPEGLRTQRSVKGFLARLIGTLSVHGSVIPKQVRRLSKQLFEVPVFTMSVACKREVLFRAGLYDESVDEPILGEDYDLALRIRRSGYVIVQNLKAVAYHFTRQITKTSMKLRCDPKYLEGIYSSEVYFIVKNRKLLGWLPTIMHALYRVIESVYWGARVGKLSVIIHGIIGTLKGLIKGISVYD